MGSQDVLLLPIVACPSLAGSGRPALVSKIICSTNSMVRLLAWFATDVTYSKAYLTMLHTLPKFTGDTS